MRIVRLNILIILVIMVVSWNGSRTPAYGDTYEKVWDSGGITSNRVSDVAVGDTDGDGKFEIIISDQPSSGGAKIYLFENIGDNSYQLVWDSGTTLTMRICYLEIGDQDIDGNLEIIAVESKNTSPYNSKIHIFENTGDNTFQEIWNNGSAFNGMESDVLFLGDADNDGKREIIVRTATKIRVYENTNIGDDSYQEIWNSGATLYDTVREGAVGDTDGDGKKEIIVGSGGIDTQVHVFENNGDDSYEFVWDSGSTFSGGSVLANIGDPNGDGKIEIIAGGGDRIIHIFEHTGNIGENSYASVWNSGSMTDFTSLVAIGDQDNDGEGEIIVPCADSKVYVFENIGNNNYQEVWNSGTNMSDATYRVATGDQDRDGKREIIAACWDGKVYVFENKEGIPSDLDSCLIAYYPFNGNASDASGTGNHGSIYGATLTYDRFGNPNSAYNFDGKNDYMIIGNDASLKMTNIVTLVA